MIPRATVFAAVVIALAMAVALALSALAAGQQAHGLLRALFQLPRPRRRERERERERRRLEEGFEGRAPESEQLTAAGRVHGDPTRCTVWPAGYSFAAEGLVAHPDSTADDPKCILLRDGMGLLTSDDPTVCAPLPDLVDLHWMNPLNQAGNGGAIAAVRADHVAGLDRCAISFAPGTSADDLALLDTELALAGAQKRSSMPLVLKQLETTTAALKKTAESLAEASRQLQADRSQMREDAGAVAECQRDVEQTELRLQDLERASESAMHAATMGFQQQYGQMQSTYQQRLSQRIRADQGQMDQVAAAVRTCTDKLSTCQSSLAAPKADDEKCHKDLDACNAKPPCPPQKECPAAADCPAAAACPAPPPCPVSRAAAAEPAKPAIVDCTGLYRDSSNGMILNITCNTATGEVSMPPRPLNATITATGYNAFALHHRTEGWTTNSSFVNGEFMWSNNVRWVRT